MSVKGAEPVVVGAVVITNTRLVEEARVRAKGFDAMGSSEPAAIEQNAFT